MEPSVQGFPEQRAVKATLKRLDRNSAPSWPWKTVLNAASEPLHSVTSKTDRRALASHVGSPFCTWTPFKKAEMRT